MTRISPLLALVAAAALAGCNEDHTIRGGPAGEETNSAANAGVVLPPAIAASKMYRCSGDNSIVQVDWLADNKTANVRVGQDGPATQVTTAEEGKPMTGASGLSLTGTAGGTSITVKLPEGATKSCHV